MRRVLLLGFPLLALTGCTRLLQPAGPAPRAWSADAPPDSIARWALDGCRALSGSRVCVERALYTVLESAGVGAAMAALDRAVELSPGLLPDAHGMAHGLGIAAYRSPETLAATFASCPPTQMSGCYHGLIQGYFLALKRQGRPLDAAALDGVCEPHRADGMLHFQCAHGLGHGVMAFVDNHLPRALERCDLITAAEVRQACYGGAFMENIVAATHPHHTAEAHAAVGTHRPGEHAGPGAAADEHAGHGAAGDQHAGHGAAGEHAGHGAAGDEHAGHGAHEGEATRWRPLRRDDLLYPCTVVDERYHTACYDMQSSAAIALTVGDVGAVARACERAPAGHVRRCWSSLGRDVSALAELNHRRAVELCGRAGAAARPVCIAGVAATMHNRSNDPADAVAFCRDVPPGDGKEACYQTALSAIAAAPPQRRGPLCETVEAEFTAACRAAAGVSPASRD